MCKITQGSDGVVFTLLVIKMVHELISVIPCFSCNRNIFYLGHLAKGRGSFSSNWNISYLGHLSKGCGLNMTCSYYN
jgi:hypothetical protein